MGKLPCIEMALAQQGQSLAEPGTFAEPEARPATAPSPSGRRHYRSLYAIDVESIVYGVGLDYQLLAVEHLVDRVNDPKWDRRPLCNECEDWVLGMPVVRRAGARLAGGAAGSCSGCLYSMLDEVGRMPVSEPEPEVAKAEQAEPAEDDQAELPPPPEETYRWLHRSVLPWQAIPYLGPEDLRWRDGQHDIAGRGGFTPAPTDWSTSKHQIPPGKCRRCWIASGFDVKRYFEMMEAM